MIARAKRAGWDERLTDEQSWDLDPYGDDGPHASDDLEGELAELEFPETVEHPAFKLVTVGGQEADPKTVEVLKI